MKAVFADTSFFLAVINPKDQFHDIAMDLNLRQKVPLVTTAWVLAEVANALAGSRARQRFVPLVAGLRSQSDAEIVPASERLFGDGCALYGKRLDKEWSLTDCISFCVMWERGIDDALTADHHFAQAGLRPLMEVE